MTEANLALQANRSKEDPIDTTRRYLSYLTWGIIGAGTILYFAIPASAVGGSLVLAGAFDYALDKTLGEEVSKNWKEFKLRVGNIFTFKGPKTRQMGTQPIPAN